MARPHAEEMRLSSVLNTLENARQADDLQFVLSEIRRGYGFAHATLLVVRAGISPLPYPFCCTASRSAVPAFSRWTGMRYARNP